jgi:hypothetical protein
MNAPAAHRRAVTPLRKRARASATVKGMVLSLRANFASTESSGRRQVREPLSERTLRQRLGRGAIAFGQVHFKKLGPAAEYLFEAQRVHPTRRHSRPRAGSGAPLWGKEDETGEEDLAPSRAAGSS